MTDEIKLPQRLDMGDAKNPDALYYGLLHETVTAVDVHWHYFFEIDFVIEGKGTQNVNGVNIPYERGTMTLLSDSDFHGYEVNAEAGPTRVYSLHFSDGFPDEVTMTRLRAIAGHPLSCGDEEAFASMQKTFETILVEMESDTPERDDFVRNTLTRIILLIARRYRESTSADSTVNAIPGELLYLDSHFREHITEEDAARHSGFSTAYFSKLFRKRYGVTFQHYLLNKRLQWAYGLIRSSSLSITAICYEAGFNSHNYFSRRFKLRYGISPMEARKRYRKENTNNTHE